MRLCTRIRRGSKPLFVEVQTEPWAVENECFANVWRKIAESGGRIQFGWAIWRCNGFFVEAEHHAVYEAVPGAKLIDISKQVPHVPRILFVPDDAAVRQLTETGQRDNIRMALSKNPDVLRFLSLVEARTKLTNAAAPANGMVTLHGRDAKLLYLIQEELCRLVEKFSPSTPHQPHSKDSSK